MRLTREHRCVVLQYLKDNGPSATWCIAGKLGIDTRKALQFMKSLSYHGDVQLSDRYSSVNNSVWEIKP